ncbi:hypothetical protein [Sulfobacillus thermosulfidooxidans]|uniref:hypothetical protein n=1 Tax=Sulfobacillus thermosulfidooxidans TaxID=28034 RepID=UPI0006B635B8|nr:hypothetical protein [Sulfobacillus thermosulfidooxidans]
MSVPINGSLYVSDAELFAMQFLHRTDSYLDDVRLSVESPDHFLVSGQFIHGTPDALGSQILAIDSRVQGFLRAVGQWVQTFVDGQCFTEPIPSGQVDWVDDVLSQTDLDCPLCHTPHSLHKRLHAEWNEIWACTQCTAVLFTLHGNFNLSTLSTVFKS